MRAKRFARRALATSGLLAGVVLISLLSVAITGVSAPQERTSAPTPEPTYGSKLPASSSGRPPQAFVGGAPTEWVAGRYVAVTSARDASEVTAGRLSTPGPGPNGSGLCSWERARNGSISFNAITASGNINTSESITVKKGEFLRLTGDCVWRVG